MRAWPQARRLSDGRLHLHDGPIDLIIEAFADRDAIEAAYAAAWMRFQKVLDELCAELPLLRAQAAPQNPQPDSVVARRMAAAVAPFCATHFITPMAAVAGAVAEEILAAMVSAAPLARAYVNNGGDIALHLSRDEQFSIGMVDRPDRPSLIGAATIRARDPIRGVATSGWRGRSLSLGIADAVTILARTAATADAAATLVANAVDLPNHPAIQRAPASSSDPQSDLGDRLVTIAVGALASEDVDNALASGRAEAERLKSIGAIEAAALRLRGETRLCGVEARLYNEPGVSRDAARKSLPHFERNEAIQEASAAPLLLRRFTSRNDGTRDREKERDAMPSVEERKRVVSVEEIFHEGGPAAAKAYRRAFILSVIKNPFAGRYVEDIVGFSEDLKPLGLDLAKALIAALGGDAKAIEGYGKGAIVGAAGEIEHGALWHVPGGYAMREALGGAKAIVPSAKKVAGPGARLDVPITHINASYVRSHFDAIEVGIADAPRADEILLALAMTTGARVHDRAGGLKASEIRGVDGLR